LQKEDSSDGFAKTLKDGTNVEIGKMRDMFNKHKSDVVSMMMHHVSTVDLTVGPASKQALIKFVSEQQARK